MASSSGLELQKELPFNPGQIVEVDNQLRWLTRAGPFALELDIVKPGIASFVVMEQDEIKEKLEAEENIEKLKLTIEEIDRKLNLLLDSYLDGVVEAEIYKQKKNELFEQKLKIQEEIAKIKTDGSSWLEPMREFVNVAINCDKIARAKNSCEDLAIFAKCVGSNFFLKNRRLVANYKKGFDTVKSYAGGCPAATRDFTKSESSRGYPT